jgi:serine/threonine protein kinase
MGPSAIRGESGMGAVGGYRLHGEIASGGMATVHLGVHAASSKVVAIKRLHAQFAKDPEFVAMFLDEARVARRIEHPNVIRVHDVVSHDGELFIVMEHVLGSPLSLLLRRASFARAMIAPSIVTRILVDVLDGLHAAHETVDEAGSPLDVVHRDVSPQNVLVGADGVSRVFDFGIAKAAGRFQASQKGQLKGKLSYLAPEQIHEEPVSGRTDVYAASVVLWEALTGRRLFRGEDERGTLAQVLDGVVPPPSASAPGLSRALDRVVLRGLDRVPSNRYETAREMALALASACPPAPLHEVGAWVVSLAHEEIASTEQRIATMGRVAASFVRPGRPSRVVVGRGAATGEAIGARGRRIGRRRSILALAALLEIAAILMGVWLATGGRAWRGASMSLPPGQPSDSAKRRMQ